MKVMPFVMLLWLACTSLVRAQEPARLYVDADPAARAFQPEPGMKGQFRDQLNQTIQKSPRDVTARVQRAYLLQGAGDRAGAQADWNAALGAAVPGSVFERRVLWSRGWASYDAGDARAALQDWQRAVQLHGGAPFWAAYTYALGHAGVGQMDQAVTWYDAAVRANPQWASEQGFMLRTQHWKAPQRAAMRAVFDAWTKRHAGLSVS